MTNTDLWRQCPLKERFFFCFMGKSSILPLKWYIYIFSVTGCSCDVLALRVPIDMVYLINTFYSSHNLHFQQWPNEWFRLINRATFFCVWLKATGFVVALLAMTNRHIFTPLVCGHKMRSISSWNENHNNNNLTRCKWKLQ